MDNKSISESLRAFWAKQCQEPIVGSRIKETIGTLKELLHGSGDVDPADTSQYQRSPAPGGPVGTDDE